MAKQQDPNSLGAMMAAQNELASLNAGRLQNSQAEQAFLQQQQAANAVMMQAAQIGASGGVGQQVGAMNPQTQAILAQYGITGAPAMPGKTTSTSKTTQSGGNVKIENNTTTNNDVKIINPGGGGGGNADAGNQAKFQAWLSNAFAKQGQEYEVQRRAFARRDRDLEKQSNKMMRELEKSTKGLSEKLNPENWQKAQGNQMKTFMTVLLLSLAPLLVKPITEKLQSLKNFFTGKNESDTDSETAEKGFFEKLGDAIGLGTEGEKPLESIRKTLEDGIEGVRKWLELLFEERGKAIEAVKRPGDGGGWSGNPVNWLEYLGKVLVAGLGGFSSVANMTAKGLRTEANTSYTSANEEAIDIKSNYRDLLYVTGDSAKDDFRTISSGYYDIAGRLKGGTSGGSIAVTRGIWQEFNEAAKMGGTLDVSIVGKRMSDLENLIDREGVFRLGSELDARRFLEVWGLDDVYFEDMIKNKLIFSERFRYISWKEKRTEKTGVFSKNETLPFDVSKITSETEVDIYFMTKAGFDKIKKDVFGDEKFKFKEAKNDIHIQKVFSSKNPNLKFSNEDLQLVQDAQTMAEEYSTARKNTSFGRAGEVAEVIGEGIGSVGNRLNDITSDVWKYLAGSDALGEYPNNEEGKKGFIRDLFGVFSNELYAFYKKEGLPEEEAKSRAGNMARILVGQCAHESGYGTNPNSPYYNYANLTATKRGRKTRDGSDKDKDGNSITQIFRTFSSAKDFAQSMIGLLSRAPQYKGSLYANSSEEYFKLIQRGYADNPENGKFAQDPNYISNGVKSVNSINSEVETYVKELEQLKKEELTPENIETVDSKGNPIHITEDKQYKIVFDKNTYNEKNPWESQIGVYKYNDSTQLYDIPIDANLMGSNISGPNSLEETVNRELSSTSDFSGKINFGEKILFYTQKRIKFKKRARQKILETCYTLEGSEKEGKYKNIPFYIIPTSDGSQFTILTINVRTIHTSWLQGPIWTGEVYESPNGSDFPKDCKKGLSQETLSNCPAHRNPLFYSIAFELDEEGLEALRKWKQILKTISIDDREYLKYTNEKGNDVRFDRNKDAEILKELERIGVITDRRADSLGVKATLTEKGKNFYGDGKSTNYFHHPSSSDWATMSEKEKNDYFNYLANQTDNVSEKAAIRMLNATAENALIEAQRIVGVVSSPTQYRIPAQRITNTNTSPNLVEDLNQNHGNTVYRAGDNNAVDNSQTVFHIYGSWGNEASKATGES